MSEEERARRLKARRIKDLIDKNLSLKMSTIRIAEWMHYQSGVEFRRGNDEEAEWYRQRYGVICDLNDGYERAASILFRRFRKDFGRDIQSSPGS